MDTSEQIAHFTTQLNALTERFQAEWDMDYQTMIGCLDLHKAILIEECLGFSFEVPDEGEDEDGEHQGSIS